MVCVVVAGGIVGERGAGAAVVVFVAVVPAWRLSYERHCVVDNSIGARFGRGADCAGDRVDLMTAIVERIGNDDVPGRVEDHLKHQKLLGRLSSVWGSSPISWPGRRSSEEWIMLVGEHCFRFRVDGQRRCGCEVGFRLPHTCHLCTDELWLVLLFGGLDGCPVSGFCGWRCCRNRRRRWFLVFRVGCGPRLGKGG
jgi:hypothetical protein